MQSVLVNSFYKKQI